MPFGTPVTVSREIESKMLRSAEKLLKEYETEVGFPVYQGIYSNVGRKGGHNTSVRIYLKPLEERVLPPLSFQENGAK